MKLDIDKLRKVTKADYPKKFGSSKKSKNVIKMTVFDFFLKTTPTILIKLGQNVDIINSEHLAKTACQKKFCSGYIHQQSWP